MGNGKIDASSAFALIAIFFFFKLLYHLTKAVFLFSLAIFLFLLKWFIQFLSPPRTNDHPRSNEI